MSKTVLVSDELYTWLEEEADNLGLDSIEDALEQIQHELRVRRRQEVVRRINENRERLFKKYGKMEDSVASIREDRAR